jgi:hypothetical protein
VSRWLLWVVIPGVLDGWKQELWWQWSCNVVKVEAYGEKRRFRRKMDGDCDGKWSWGVLGT